MGTFVRDMHLHVHTPGGEKTAVEAPADANVGKFVDSLQDPLRLRSRDAEGHRVQWHVHDREGRRLDPNKSLGDNGVAEGHDLYFQEEREHPVEPKPDIFKEMDQPKEKPKAKEDEKVLLRCENGHFYDPKKHATCPYCGLAATDTPTTPRKEEPVKASSGEAGPTRPVSFANSAAVAQGDEPTKRVPFDKTLIDPVVGWFVCAHGPEKGKDYRIRIENNTIGRDEDMNISIKDNMISRQRHAYVTFDPQTNRFYIRPGEARGLVHRNGNVVFQAEELHAFDEILLGQTRLVFVPLCGEHFKWE
jgi:hypothetical protein